MTSIGKKWSLEKAIDFPHIPEHIYYEGYGHALPTPNFIDSMNPRWGHRMEKNRAPKRVVAFVTCFKELNKTWIQDAFCQPNENGEFHFFGKLTKNDFHLADLAMQFHWGDEIDEDNIGWHVDGR